MILPTIGPVTSSYKNLKLVLSYSKFVRINGSHNKISWHKNISKIIKKLIKTPESYWIYLELNPEL